MLKQKQFDVEIKASEDANGIIEGYASTWIRKADAYGDVVRQGAFKKSLQKLHDEGKTIPLIWSHQLDNLKSYIGTCVADEDERGLHFVATFEDTEDAQKVRQMYRDGRLSKFSFAYNVIDQGPITLEDGTKANELREVEIYEISCVLVPANDDASVVDVKAGKRNSSKDEETIKSAIELLQQLLETVVEEKIEPDNDENDSESKSSDNVAAEDQELINEKKASLLELIKKIEL